MLRINFRFRPKTSPSENVDQKSDASRIHSDLAATARFGRTARRLNRLVPATAGGSGKILSAPDDMPLPGNSRVVSKPDKTRAPTPQVPFEGYPTTVDILGLKFPLLDYASTLDLFGRWIAGRESHQVCMANVHTVVTSLTDIELKNIKNRSLITMDGLPLVWYARAVHRAKIKERVCGPELMLRCLDQGRERGWKHFFLGGKGNVLTDLVCTMRSRFPGVEIVGWHSPPFRPLTSEEDAQLVALINQHQPDFLWVGLGAPKQEKWIADHLSVLDVTVQAGVGAAFDFHSGHVRRAPLWMQNAGLEWLYRMLQERRLIKRYFTTNPIFLSIFLRDILVKNLFGS